MFNGNINNKHYTDPNEYYHDLNELSKKGENFTASCSYSTKTETETPCTCKKECSELDSFIKDNVVDLNWIKGQYNKSIDKASYIKKLEASIPYTLGEKEADRLAAMSEADLATLMDYVNTRDIQNETEREYINDSIKKIDETYKSLDQEREKIVNALKEVNKKIEDLLKVRENYEDQDVMCKVLSSVYSDLMKRIEDELDLEEFDDEEDFDDEVEEPTEQKEDKDSLTIEDLVNSFKVLYNKFLA